MIEHFKNSYIFKKNRSYIIYDFYTKEYHITYNYKFIIKTKSEEIARIWMKRINKEI